MNAETQTEASNEVIEKDQTPNPLVVKTGLGQSPVIEVDEIQGVSSAKDIPQSSQIPTFEKILDKSNKMDIVSFSPEMEMKWNAWLAYFETLCLENKKDNLWKIKNIQKFLQGRALTLYINNCLNVLHWEELVELFNEEFHIPGEPSLREFTDIKFKQGEELNQYYQKKMQVGRALGLESQVILEGLTDGLPIELRQLVITNTPKNTSEWRELVYKLNKIQIAEKPNNNMYRKPYESSNPNPFRQWRPQRFSNPSYVPQPRIQQWGYRNPNIPNSIRTYPQNYGGNQYRTPRPTVDPNRKPNLHYNESLSPAPCRICLNIGIPNAYHWARNCPFKRQTLDTSQIRHDCQATNKHEGQSQEQNEIDPQAGSNFQEGASKLF